MGYASNQLGAPLAEYHDYGTFDGLGQRKKKKRGFFRKVGRVAKKVGKVALKAAPIVAGLTLGPVGGIAVGAASGAIGRGKPKLKRIFRGAAYGGAAGLVRTGQAGRILVKGGKATLKLAKGGGRIVGKLGRGAGGVIERIAGGDIGPTEGAVIGAGGGLVYEKLKKKRRPRPEAQMPDEPLTPEELPYDHIKSECEAAGGIWTRSGCIMPPSEIRPPIEHLPLPEGEGPTPQPALPPGEAPMSPTETPTAGQLPVAGGLIPGPATNAMMPGSGGEQFAPAATEEVVPDETRKPNTALLLAAGVAVVVLLAAGKKGRKR